MWGLGDEKEPAENYAVFFDIFRLLQYVSLLFPCSLNLTLTPSPSDLPSSLSY